VDDEVVRIRLDPSSPTALSAQLRDGLAGKIRGGRLLPGDRVPPVRELATELGLAPNTVARAYRELETTGLLVGRGRHGTFVAERLPEGTTGAAADLERAAGTYARRARQLGMSPREALSAARRALDATA